MGKWITWADEELDCVRAVFVDGEVSRMWRLESDGSVVDVGQFPMPLMYVTEHQCGNNRALQFEGGLYTRTGDGLWKYDVELDRWDRLEAWPDGLVGLAGGAIGIRG